MPRIHKYMYMHNIHGHHAFEKESTLWHEFDHVCGTLQTTMIRHAAVGISSCKIINNINIFPYQEINSHNMSRSTIKLTKWHMRNAKTQVGVFAVHMKKQWVFSYPLSAHRKLWSDWVDARADLSLHLAHRLFCLFCHVVTEMISECFGAELKKSSLSTIFIWIWAGTCNVNIILDKYWPLFIAPPFVYLRVVKTSDFIV